MVYPNNNNPGYKLQHEANCYGLPYGYFGLVCWALSILAISLTYANFTLFACWRGCQPYYKSQSSWMAVIAAAMTLGPTIYTCFHCSGDLAVLLLAVGQLTPWSFKMLNDGARGSQTANAPIKTPSHSKSSSTNVNTSYYPGSECGDNSDAGNAEKAIKGPTDADKSRDKFYTLLGGF
ncbi:11081_t:CDS:2, partial [Paraglomus brasilianum]